MKLFLLAILMSWSSTITIVTKTAHDKAAVVGLTITFRDESGQVTGHCVSDSQGVCTMPLQGETTGIIRGTLDLGPSGTRSLIWVAPEDLTVELFFDEFGHLLTPGHTAHPTPDTWSAQPTALPTASPTAIGLPTTAYVVLDPQSTPIEAHITATIESHIAETHTAIVATPLPLETPTTTPPFVPPVTRPWGLIFLCLGLFILLWGGSLLYIRSRRHA